jgi:hypothetical protein
LLWLQDPNEINGNNLNNVRREARKPFRKEGRDTWETIIISQQQQKIRTKTSGIL